MLDKCNSIFNEDAQNIRYELPNKIWSKKMPLNFSELKYGIARSIKSIRDNEFLCVLEIDCQNGLTKNALNCIKEFYRKFDGYCWIKASGLRGFHGIIKLSFDKQHGIKDIINKMRDLIYTFYVKNDIKNKFNLAFAKNSKEDYIDARMFEYNRLIRGFCVRFDKDGNITKRYSVPIEEKDTLEDVEEKILLKRDIKIINQIEPIEVSFRTKLLRCPEIVDDERIFFNVNNPLIYDDLYEKKEKINIKDINEDMFYREIINYFPDMIKTFFFSWHPSHYAKVCVVIWLNWILYNNFNILSEKRRIEIINDIIINYMPLGVYRLNGKFNIERTKYQIRHIIQKGYNIPKITLNGGD